jgi:hypothetical protein
MWIQRCDSRSLDIPDAAIRQDLGQEFGGFDSPGPTRLRELGAQVAIGAEDRPIRVD